MSDLILKVTEIPLEVMVAEAWDINDQFSQRFDARLQQYGGLDLLLDRMTPEQQCLWKPLDIALDCAVLERPLSTEVVLVGSERSVGALGKVGLHTTIGKRVNGDFLWFEPFEAPRDLAYTANGLLHWREMVAELRRKSRLRGVPTD